MNHPRRRNDEHLSPEQEAQEIIDRAEEEERYKEYQENQDHPQRDEGERFQDRYDMYRREY